MKDFRYSRDDARAWVEEHGGVRFVATMLATAWSGLPRSADGVGVLPGDMVRYRGEMVKVVSVGEKGKVEVLKPQASSGSVWVPSHAVRRDAEEAGLVVSPAEPIRDADGRALAVGMKAFAGDGKEWQVVGFRPGHRYPVTCALVGADCERDLKPGWLTAEPRPQGEGE